MNKFEMVVEEVKELMGAGYKVSLNEVRKNNGVVLHAVVIQEGGSVVSPNIYIDELVEEKSVSKAAAFVKEQYEIHSNDIEVDASMLGKKSYILKNVFYQLVNTDRNEEMLKEVPHREMLDLSVIYRVLVEQRNDGSASFILKNDIMNIAEISMEELEEAAFKNTIELRKVNCASMEDFMKHMMFGMPIQNTSVYDVTFDEMPGFIALTNASKTHGAAMVIYKDILNTLAEKAGADLYIIPSSVHEVLILKATTDVEPEELRNMVCQVNEDEVPDDEFLSNNVYIYRKETEELEIA